MADSDISPLGPRDVSKYEQEYRQAADLFKKTADQYAKSDNMYQKEEFKQVMDKALQIMQEAAQALMRQELLKQNDKIAQDLSAFESDPGAKTKSKLVKDLDRAKDQA